MHPKALIISVQYIMIFVAST